MDGLPFHVPSIRPEFVYVGLIFALFVLPRALQRFRLPPAITSLALGAIAALGPGWFAHDATIELLSTLGIVSLFLFAGLEMDVHELNANRRVLAQHLLIRGVLTAGVGWAAHAALGLSPRPALLVALALVTPSTGFILDSIKSFGFSPREEGWVKSKAISAELLALVALFAVTQSASVTQLLVSTVVIVAMIALLPLVFRAFARLVVPHARGSEFAFLLMVAVVCAIVTRELGVYYLVGAFVVGVAAQRFRTRLPAFASREMLHAMELFASFFVPFYFFHAGLGLKRADFAPESLLVGLVMTVVILPIRIVTTGIHRRLALDEPIRSGARIGIALLPTLVFTLVIAQILRDQFAISTAVFGGLIVYTLANTLIPGLIFKAPTPDLTTPMLAADEPGRAADAGSRTPPPPTTASG